MPPATWYAAGQTLWRRRRPGDARLSAKLATTRSIGAAGLGRPFRDCGRLVLDDRISGRPSRRHLPLLRRQPALPAQRPLSLAAGAIALIVALVMGGRMIDAQQSLHGLGLRQAIDPLRVLLHTAQAILEYLIVGGLGLSTETNPLQGAIVCVFVAVLWIWSRRDGWRFNRLECSAGAYVRQLLHQMDRPRIRALPASASDRALISRHPADRSGPLRFRLALRPPQSEPAGSRGAGA